MKIKVSDSIAVESKSIETMTCPAGTAYWHIEYRYQGMVVHTAHTKAIWGSPDTLTMLDQEFEVFRRLPAKPTEEEANGRSIYNDGQGKWSEKIIKTHRQAIIDAVAQLVE